MSRYGIILMYAHFFMVPMHVTLQNGTTYANYGMHDIINVWHGTNACHTIYGIVTIHVTLQHCANMSHYGMKPMHVITMK